MTLIKKKPKNSLNLFFLNLVLTNYFSSTGPLTYGDDRLMCMIHSYWIDAQFTVCNSEMCPPLDSSTTANAIYPIGFQSTYWNMFLCGFRPRSGQICVKFEASGGSAVSGDLGPLPCCKCDQVAVEFNHGCHAERCESQGALRLSSAAPLFGLNSHRQ